MKEIAIIGIGCRFPGAENTESFWRLLSNKVDAINQQPSRSFAQGLLNNPAIASQTQIFNNIIRGGFLEDVESFDPSFFQISPKESENMDPQQRLLLEVAWESLENAGIGSLSDISDSQTGVFLGVCNYDYGLLSAKNGQINAYTAIGNSLSIIANRLSYIFNLKGPSLVIDTACSSSLVAVHYACQSLQTRESNLCIAGGVNLILSSEGTISLSAAQMMAADGRCKTFDAAADGYVRGEGCGIVILKRLTDAIRDGDNIQAIIKGSALNQDGLSNGLTAPNGPSQQAVIRQALANADVKPAQISYVETHGTGTILGDPIEVNSLKTVLMEERKADQICWIGSVKTNIGHLEGAAGIAGLIKVVLSLQHRQIPAHLHLKQLNPYIKINNTPIQIPTELQPWKTQEELPLAGISAFGFGGTNAHLILTASPGKVKDQNLCQPAHNLLTLSAKTAPALQALVNRYQQHLENHPQLTIANICYTANTGRSHFEHRLAMVVESSEKLKAQLAAFTAGKDIIGLSSGEVISKKSPKIAFLFTGQGCQYVNMGRELYNTQPVFRQTLEQCDQILKADFNYALLDILYPTSESANLSPLIDQTAYTQPALFAFAYALYQLWKSWGIQPDVVMGHSVGEYVAACVAGVFSWQDAIKLLAHRGKLMQQLPSGGEMWAVFASEIQVRHAITCYDQKVAIAAINGPESVVISGASQELKSICQQLELEGIKTKQLQVSHAFHSPLMLPMLAEFALVAAEITYNKPQIPIISNLTGKPADQKICTASYWVDHICQSVQFAESIETLHQQKYKLFVEIGPKPILLGMARQCGQKETAVWLPSIRADGDELATMLSSLGQLYIKGVKINWAEFYRHYQCEKVVLPTYPFQRQRYWMTTSNNQPQKPSLQTNKNLNPILGEKLHLAGLEKQHHFVTELSIFEPAYLTHHRVFNKPVFPGPGYLAIALAAGAAVFKSKNLILENVTIYQALIFSEEQAKTVQTVLKPVEMDNSYNFEIFSLSSEPNSENPSFTRHASGKVMQGSDTSELEPINLAILQKQYTEEVSIENLYEKLDAHGMNYGASFQVIKNFRKNVEQGLALIELSPELCLETEKYTIHPVLLDSCLHSLYGQRLDIAQDSQMNIYLPIKIERLKLYHTSTATSSYKLWSQVKISEQDPGNQETVSSEAVLFDENGIIVAEITGLIGKKVSLNSFLNLLQRQLLGDIQSKLYQVEWQPQSIHLKTKQQKLSHWVIFADAAGLGIALATQLQQQGHECTLVYRGETYQHQNPGIYQLNPTHPQDFTQLYSSILNTSQLPLEKIIHLWSLDIPASEDLTISSLEESQSWGSGSVLHLIQTIVKNPIVTSPKLWLITRGSQPVLATTDKISVAQSPIWGFGRVISLEYPQLWGGLLDLDPQTPENDLEICLELLLIDNLEEDHLARRNQQTYVCRLVKKPVQISPSVSLLSNVTYLITGGLGALGLHTAQWMVEKGAKNLVLISRRQPSKLAQAAIHRLEKQGVKVFLAHVDVGNFAELTNLFQQLQTSMPPLKGIIHAAGVISYQTISQMELSQLTAVMRPKLLGGWILHQLTKDQKLDFFVNFSSIASVWGATNQADYAAANHFLDALTYYRQAIGLPSITVNWGPWAGGGMAEEQGLKELSKRGVEPLSPSQAIAALEYLWGNASVQTTVAEVNWSLFKQLYGIGKQRLLLEEIETQTKTSLTDSQNTKIKQQIETANSKERQDLLITYLQKQIGKILGIKANQRLNLEQSFFEMGMDSLMIVELKNQIQTDLKLDISITTFMQGVNIADLSTKLNYELSSLNPTQTIELDNSQEFQLESLKYNDWIEIEI